MCSRGQRAAKLPEVAPCLEHTTIHLLTTLTFSGDHGLVPLTHSYLHLTYIHTTLPGCCAFEPPFSQVAISCSPP